MSSTLMSWTHYNISSISQRIFSDHRRIFLSRGDDHHFRRLRIKTSQRGVSVVSSAESVTLCSGCGTRTRNTDWVGPESLHFGQSPGCRKLAVVAGVRRRRKEDPGGCKFFFLSNLLAYLLLKVKVLRFYCQKVCMTENRKAAYINGNAL